MPSRPDEIQTRMDPQINLILSLGLLLLPHIRLMLVIYEIHNRRPRVAVVHVVAEPGGVDDGELRLELFLLELGFDNFDFGELVELLVVAPVVVLGGGELGGEERVDERGFAESGFTCRRGGEWGRSETLMRARLTNDHDGEVCPVLRDDFVPL